MEKVKHNYKPVSGCGELFDITGMPRKYFRSCYFCDVSEKVKKLNDVNDDCICNDCIEKEVLKGNYISREDEDNR